LHSATSQKRPKVVEDETQTASGLENFVCNRSGVRGGLVQGGGALLKVCEANKQEREVRSFGNSIKKIRTTLHADSSRG